MKFHRPEFLKKPWLLLSPQLAHDLSPYFLKIYGQTHSPQIASWQSFTWRGLKFSNPLGIAGGVDKNAEALRAWWALGSGFLEVGTVTPLPQKANPGKIVDRSCAENLVWNRMGFPNNGAEKALHHLSENFAQRASPIFVNIGKNRNTPLEKAHADYVACAEKLKTVADAFVVNISSPNTQDLRQLLKPEFFAPLIKKIKSVKDLPPLLVKMSPDLEAADLQVAVHVGEDLGVDGWILTNTTLTRPENSRWPSEGGLSGAFLSQKSKALLVSAKEKLSQMNSKSLLVSVGGVLTPEDVFERLKLGAHLVQVYSSLILDGPFFFRNVADKARPK